MMAPEVLDAHRTSLAFSSKARPKAASTFRGSFGFGGVTSDEAQEAVDEGEAAAAVKTPELRSRPALVRVAA
jgi:hypothetical protein